MSHEEFKLQSGYHQAKGPLHIAGPGIRYYSAGKTFVADVTIPNMMVASHQPLRRRTVR
jgi:hypothetical protein